MEHLRRDFSEGDLIIPKLRPHWRWVVAVAAVLVFVLFVVYFFKPSSPTPGRESSIANGGLVDDITDPVVTNPGYVGPEACLECHAGRAATTGTKHFRACREPRGEEMPVGFAAGKGKVDTRVPGFHFEMFRRGDDFIQAAVQSTPHGEQRTEARVGLIYGSAPADEVYHAWRGDRLYELKVAWLHPFNEWGYETLNPHIPGDRSRDSTTRCVECHNTWLGHVPGTTNEYLPAGRLFGVTCENCHGPGREHVAYHKIHPGEKAGHAVSHPGKLSRERAIDVCLQCHSNADRPRGPAFAFRPGESVEAHFRTSTSRFPEEDHVANQIAYLRQSKCFQKSEMTCTTCHDPHKPADHAALERSCQSCHQPNACKDRPHQPVGVQEKCVACHMPPRVWENVHFHTRDDEYKPVVKRFDHRIAVHPEGRDAVLWNWFQSKPDEASRRQAEELKVKLRRYWVKEAGQRERAFRALAAVGAYREAFEFDPSPTMRQKIRTATGVQAKLDADWVDAINLIETRRTGDAIGKLEAILATKPDHSGAHGKLGRLLAEAGRRDEAEKHLQAVAVFNPNDAYGLNLLGWLAYLDDRNTEAIHFYRAALQIEPYSAEIQTRIGSAYFKLERWPEAEEAFRSATTIDPTNAGAFQAMAAALRMLKRPTDAVRYARRAVKLTDHKNLDALLTLADAYADVGRWDDAHAIGEEALKLARTNSSPQVELAVKSRLEKYKASAK